jgi:hypothetical protein
LFIIGSAGIMHGMDSESIQTIIFLAIGILSMTFILGRMSVTNPIRREFQPIAFAGALVLLAIFGLSSTNPGFAAGMGLLATVIAAVIATMSLRQTAELEKRRSAENMLDETITWLKGIDSKAVELIAKDLMESHGTYLGTHLAQVSIMLTGESVNFGYFKALNAKNPSISSAIATLENEYSKVKPSVEYLQGGIESAMRSIASESVQAKKQGRELTTFEMKNILKAVLSGQQPEPFADLANVAWSVRQAAADAIGTATKAKMELLSSKQ